MIAWLKLINPKVWIVVALFILFALFTGAVYRAGGAGPRADLVVLKEGVRAAHSAQVKEDARREAEHKTLIKGKDDEREKTILAVSSAWDTYAAGLRADASRAKRDTESVRIASKRCDNATGNDAVSAAVSSFRDEVRAAVAGFREEVAGQLKQAQLNTNQLIRVQDALAKEQQINH